jgi:hypothetical protein
MSDINIYNMRWAVGQDAPGDDKQVLLVTEDLQHVIAVMDDARNGAGGAAHCADHLAELHNAWLDSKQPVTA